MRSNDKEEPAWEDPLVHGPLLSVGSEMSDSILRKHFFSFCASFLRTIISSRNQTIIKHRKQQSAGSTAVPTYCEINDANFPM